MTLEKVLFVLYQHSISTRYINGEWYAIAVYTQNGSTYEEPQKITRSGSGWKINGEGLYRWLGY